ncbi:MAG TPA: membrane-bound lytic murein transglycosylase MltF [Steroidobacteraceae bacterium]|nr:membrane-bound lytic murein transglycosylase MltF [Steroidobacteraceae bacterium]
MRPKLPDRRRLRHQCRARELMAAVAAALLLAGCAQPQSALQRIRARGELRVVTLNAATSYYLGAQGPQGFEYRLASAFARQLQVRLVMQPLPDAAAMRAALADGRADLAAAQISPDAQWLQTGLATENYDEIAQLVVQDRGKLHAHDTSALRLANVVVRDCSPQLDLLRAIRRDAMTDLSWTALKADQPDPLQVVTDGDADYAVVDANEFEFARHLYPDATVAFTLPDARPLKWMVRADALDLAQAANGFFISAKASGEFARIARDASLEARGFDYEDAIRFRADISARLPELQAMFEQAAQSTGLDWRLLAAVGYQESKWQRQAASADGALGIMMLTSDAATTVGVKDRSDQWQSILGGARYLAQVIDTIPNRIGEPDRTWLALAAYNVGYGHLEDARVLAQMRGKDPDSWNDVRAQLPLLAQEQWYSRARRGYARGWEPARFVDQVRQYLAVLEWSGTGTVARLHEPAALPLAPSATETRRFN